MTSHIPHSFMLAVYVMPETVVAATTLVVVPATSFCMRAWTTPAVVTMTSKV